MGKMMSVKMDNVKKMQSLNDRLKYARLHLNTGPSNHCK